MKMTNRQYGEYVKKMSPNSPLIMDLVRAFLVGGLICCIGQALSNGYIQIGLNEDNASTLTSVTLIFIGALLTGLKLYDKIAKFAGAGTLVPITGFSNAVVSPAIEFKTEGLVTGLAAKMFRTLASLDINIKMISTSEIKISCLVDQSRANDAVEVLHKVFGLDSDLIAEVKGDLPNV